MAAELLAWLIRRPAGAAGITEPPAALRAVSSVGTVGVAAGRATDHALSFHRGRRPRRIWLVLQGDRRCQRRERSPWSQPGGDLGPDLWRLRSRSRRPPTVRSSTPADPARPCSRSPATAGTAMLSTPGGASSPRTWPQTVSGAATTTRSSRGWARTAGLGARPRWRRCAGSAWPRAGASCRLKAP